MNAEEFSEKLLNAAHNFASYTETYSTPAAIVGEVMGDHTYNSGSYLSGLFHSVLGYVPKIDFASKEFQPPGWDIPLPDACYKRMKLK